MWELKIVVAPFLQNIDCVGSIRCATQNLILKMAKNSTSSGGKNTTVRGYCNTPDILHFIHRELTTCHNNN